MTVNSSEVKEELTRYLSVRSATSPAFLGDTTLVFISDITGVPLLWATDLHSQKWPYQLTFGEDRVSTARTNHSGTRVAFVSDRGGDERYQLSVIENGGKKAKHLTSDMDVIHNFGCWSPDDSSIAYSANVRDRRFYDIYVRRLDESQPRLVYEQDGNNYALDWSPDGTMLLCVRYDGPFDHHLFLLRLSDGYVTALAEHQGTAAYTSAQFDPNGEYVYLVTDQGKDISQVSRIRLADGELEFLSDFDHEVEELALSSDGLLSCFTVNRNGYSELWVMENGSNTQRMVTTPPGVIGSLTWAKAGEKLAFTLSGSRFNPDIWIWSPHDDKVCRKTHSSSSGIDSESFVEPELSWTESFDGVRIPSFIYRPPGAKAPAPTVFYIHGGPESQFRPSFNQIVQFMVSKGFTVIAPNFRGSSGYGRAFTHMDDVYRRMDTVKDVLAVVERSRQLGISDPKRTAVFGGSYGGFMVLACMYSSPDTWTAGVDVVGIANFVTFLKNTGPWRRKLRIAEYGDPDRDREFLTRISPVTNAHRISAPLFVIHGKNDPRVPLNETEQIVNMLKSQNKEVHFMVFDDEGHGLVKLRNRIEGYGAAIGFMIEHLL